MAFEQVEATLHQAIDLANDCQGAHASAIPAVRRQMNRAVFKRLLVTEQGIVGWELAEPFPTLLAPGLQGVLAAALAHRNGASQRARPQHRSTAAPRTLAVGTNAGARAGR